MKKTTIGMIMALCALFLTACSDKKRDAIGHTEVVMETSMGNITP